MGALHVQDCFRSQASEYQAKAFGSGATTGVALLADGLRELVQQFWVRRRGLTQQPVGHTGQVNIKVASLRKNLRNLMAPVTWRCGAGL
ncbi:hypothetical protein D7243_05040 [Stutzerimonas stutzeri]|nr:hypothetical protein [Stutzerimonas stutzeri]